MIAIPALFLDHHRCESRLSALMWALYMLCLSGILILSVLAELSVVKRLGLVKAKDFANIWSQRRWQIPLAVGVLWRLDAYTDVVFIFIAKDCDSSLWWASLATFVFGIVFGQLLVNTCFACTDCARELPKSFGFVLLDFKLVNEAVLHALPYDPDVSNLPVSRPVTIRSTGHLVTMEKVVVDIAQVAIQTYFIYSEPAQPHGYVIFSVAVGVLNAVLSVVSVTCDCVQDEWKVQRDSVEVPLTSDASDPPLPIPVEQKQSEGKKARAPPSVVGKSARAVLASSAPQQATTEQEMQPTPALATTFADEVVDLL